MCKVCEKSRRLGGKRGLQLIAEEMKKGSKCPGLDEIVGQIIKVEQKPRDTVKEESWERARRWRTAK